MSAAELPPWVDEAPFDPAEVEVEEVGGTARAWRVENDGQAEWAMNLRNDAIAEKEGLQLQAQEYASRIDHWFTRRSAPVVRRIAYFTDQLEDYAMRLRVEHGVKTRQLPSGTVATTEQKPAVEVDDEATVVAWLEADPARAEALKVVKGVLVSEVRKLVAIAESGDVVDSDGVVVPGLAVRPGKTTAKVVPGG